MGYTVYMHTFPNGKRYIGITHQNINRRWRDGKGYEGQIVYKAILKYGWDNIEHKVLFTDLTQAEAEEKEKELIKEYKTDRHANGYNVEKGGGVMSDETKEKLIKSKKEYYKHNKHWNSGRHWSNEVKEKIAKAHTGLKDSEETLKKKSKRFSGKNNPMYGTKIPKEHKEKLQKACIEAISKKCKCIETGVIYSSMAEAGRETGITPRTISYVCNKQGYYKTAGGYHWEYVEKGGV